MTILFLSLLASLTFVGVVLSNKNLYDKGTTFFSVHVNAGFGQSESGRKVFKAFRRQVWSGIAIALAVICLAPAIPPHASTQVLLAYVIGYVVMLILFFNGHQKAKKETLEHRVEPSTKRRATLELNRESQLMRHMVMVPAYIILIAAICTVFLHWEIIPERFPQRWGVGGEVVAWQEKSVFNVLKTGLIGFTVMLFVQFVTTPEYRGKGGIKQTPLGFCLLLMYFNSVIFSTVTLIPLFATAEPGGSAILAAILIPTILLMGILLAISTYKWGKANHETITSDAGIETDPKYWGSFFYNNPDDPVLFVEKPTGLGYTINVGQPRARLYAVIPFIFIAFVLMMVLL